MKVITKKLYFIPLLILVILCSGCTSNDIDIQVDEKKVTIVDLENNERPYAVMVNNHKDARPQSGLDKAYLVYELLVEGGITRMLALYTTDAEVEKIGSVRSSRHYYLDYVLENDAIYVHWGYSEYARKDISKLKIDNVNGLTYGNTYFKTDNSLNRSLEHTRFTSSNLVKKAIKELKYRTNREGNYLLNYTLEELDLTEVDDSIQANNIDIKYSNSQTSSYKYNEEEKLYYRSMNGEKHIDLITNEQYKFKNIIVYAVEYKNLDSNGLKDIKNIGTGNGYYITNGIAAPITWEKTSRDSKTIYKYLNGEEIKVNDGNTFIQIYPTTGNLTIK